MILLCIAGVDGIVCSFESFTLAIRSLWSQHTGVFFLIMLHIEDSEAKSFPGH